MIKGIQEKYIENLRMLSGRFPQRASRSQDGINQCYICLGQITNQFYLKWIIREEDKKSMFYAHLKCPPNIEERIAHLRSQPM